MFLGRTKDDRCALLAAAGWGDAFAVDAWRYQHGISGLGLFGRLLDRAERLGRTAVALAVALDVHVERGRCDG